MKCVREDGTSIYKLTDFGAARELEDGEQFQSIYGTEEYLHPDVYERAFLTRREKTFDGTIDLWSLGVTLYHLATGTLPFKPFDGRRNLDKRVMYKITSGKESGVISGIQREKNGLVEYQKELPKNCLLSSNLRKVITPLLAGLMEADLSKTWGFEEFFVQVENILSRKPIHIFYVNKIQIFTLYVPLNQTFQEFEELIMEEIGVTTANQIFLFKNRSLIVENVSDIPVTKPEDPLFLFDKDNNDIAITDEETSLFFSKFSANASVDADALHCAGYLKIGYDFKRKIQKYSLHCRLILEIVDNFTNYLDYETAGLLSKAHCLEEKLVLLETILKFLNKQPENSSNKLISTLHSITSLQQSNYQASVDWKGVTKDVDVSYMTRSVVETTTFIDLLNKCYNQLKNYVITKTLSRNEEKLHHLEKKKSYHLLFKIQKLLRDAIRPLHKKLVENCGDWYKIAQTNFVKLEILRGDLVEVEQTLHVLNENFQSYVVNNSLKELNLKTTLRQTHNILTECKSRENYQKLIETSDNLVNELAKQSMEMERYLHSLE